MLSGVLVAEALLAVIFVVSVFATRDTVRDRLAAHFPGHTPSQLHTDLVTRLSTDVVENAVVVAGCLLLAVMIRRGHRWAWVVTLVVSLLLVPSTLAPLFRLILPTATATTPLWFAFAAGVLGVVAVVLLLLPSPRRYCFTSRSTTPPADHTHGRHQTSRQ